MSGAAWSVVLQWSRFGLSAFVFLAAARILPLSEIGAFALAYAPVRLVQTTLRAAFSETAVLGPERPRRQAALMALSLGFGAAASLIAGLAATLAGSVLMALLAPVPFLTAAGAVPEGLLRKRFALRALALRTLIAQGLAAGAALAALRLGQGAGALGLFVVLGSALSGLLAWQQAPLRPRLPRRSRVAALLRQPALIGGKDLLSSGLFPLVQLLVGAVFGLAAAGAFQIATRLLQLTETLTLAPLRFRALAELSAEPGALPATLARTARIAFWAWPGLWIAAPSISALAVGPAEAAALTPMLRALAPMGLIGALSMPLVQAVVAQGQSRITLERAAILLGLSCLSVGLAAPWSIAHAAAGLSVAMALAAGFLVWRAAAPLKLAPEDLPMAPALAGTVMAAALAWPLPAWPPLALFAAQAALGSAVYMANGGLLFRPSRAAAT